MRISGSISSVSTPVEGESVFLNTDLSLSQDRLLGDLCSVSESSRQSGSSTSMKEIFDSDLDSIRLHDVFDVADLEMLLGAFSNASGVGAAVSHPNGSLFTAHLGFSAYCSLVRSFPQGRANCKKSDALFGEEAVRTRGAVAHPCYSAGLYDSAAALWLPNGLHIGNVHVGQVAPEGCLEPQRLYLRELGASEQDVEDLMSSIFTIPLCKFQKIVSFVFTLTSKISEFGYTSWLENRYIRQLNLRDKEYQSRDSLLSGTLNSIEQAVIVLSYIDWVVIRCNRAATDLLSPALSKAKLFDVVHFHLFPSLERLTDPFTDGFANKIRFRTDQDCAIYLEPDKSLLSNKDGIIRKFVCSCTPLEDPNPNSCVLVISEVTLHREMQAKIAEASKFELMGRFSSYISHNANQYLQSISACAETLLMDDLPDAKSDVLRTIVSSSFDCSNLISRMLSITTANQNIFVLENVDVVDLVTHIQSIACSFDPKVSVSLTCDLSVGDCFVKADSSQIQSALLNLCVNSIEAIQEGYSNGSICIILERVFISEPDFHGFGITPGDFIRIVVEDNGVGVPSDHVQFVFDPFWTGKTVKGGTGVGLASVRSIVAQHGGVVLFESEVCTDRDRGRTLVHVYLPLLQLNPSDVLQSPLSRPVCFSPAELSKTRKVMLVDDSPVVVFALTSLLHRLSCDVVSFLDSNQAIESLIEMNPFPDLIIVDMLMPSLGGLEFIDLIQKYNISTPIVIASGYKFEELCLDELEQKGVVGFVQKPVSVTELKDILSRV